MFLIDLDLKGQVSYTSEEDIQPLSIVVRHSALFTTPNIQCCVGLKVTNILTKIYLSILKNVKVLSSSRMVKENDSEIETKFNFLSS